MYFYTLARNIESVFFVLVNCLPLKDSRGPFSRNILKNVLCLSLRDVLRFECNATSD